MKVMLDRSGCISCGLYAETCPEVFRMANDSVIEAYQEDIPKSTEATAVRIQEGCFAPVITVD